MSKPLVLSHTFLTNFDICPSRAQHIHVWKDVDKEMTPALIEGRAVHDALDRRVGERVPLPAQYAPYESVAAAIAPWKPFTELKLGVTAHGTATGYFDNDIWFRTVADVAAVNADRTVALLFDWKTGKVKEDPTELRRQALGLYARWPSLRTLKARYVWLRERKIGVEYDVSDVEATFRDIQERHAEISGMKGEWPRRQGPLCAWCPVKSCPFWRPSPE